MADFNAAIKLSASADNAIREIERLERRIERINDTRIEVGRDIRQSFDSATASTRRFVGALTQIRNVGAAATLTTIVSAISKIPGVNFGPLEAGIQTVGKLNTELMAAAGSAPLLAAGLTLGTTAALAYAPQIAAAAKGTLRLAAAAAEASVPIGTLARLLAEQTAGRAAFSAFGEFDPESTTRALETYRNRLFELNETVSVLGRRQAQLQGTLNKFNSESDTAAKIAAKLVDVTKRLNAEQEAQNDLLREAAGLRPQSVENRATNTYRTTQRRKTYQAAQAEEALREQQELRAMEESRSEAARASLQSQAEQRIKSLEEEAAAVDAAARALRAKTEATRANEAAESEAARASLARAAAERQAVAEAKQQAAQKGEAEAAEAARQAAQALEDQTKAIRQNEATRSAAARKSLADAAAEQRAARERTEEQKRLNAEYIREQKIRRATTRIAEEQQRRQQRRQLTESLALGAGFPLLFGGGAGSVAGGVVGSLFDQAGGFAGQILAGALGAKLDELVQKTTEFSKSLREGGDAAAFLEANLGRVDPDIINYIRNLQQSGQTAKAASAAIDELSKKIGRDNAEALQRAGTNVEQLSNKFAGLVLAVTAAGYRVNEFFERIKYGGKDPFDFVPEQFRPEKPKEEDAVTQAAEDRVRALEQQVELTRLQADAAGLVKDEQIEEYALGRKNIAIQEAKIENEKIYTDFVRGRITEEERGLLVTQKDLRLKQQLANIERDRSEAIQRAQEKANREAERAAREAERAAREAQRAAEEAQRRQEQYIKAQLSGYAELNKAILSFEEIRVKGAALQSGELGAVKLRLERLDQIQEVEEYILDLERQQAIIEAQKNGTADITTQVYTQRLKVLQGEYILQKRQLQVQQAQLELAKQQRAVQLQREQDDRLNTQQSAIDRLGTQLATPFGGPKQEQALLYLEQAERRMQELLPIIRQIEDLQSELDAGFVTEERLADINAEITAQKQLQAALESQLAVREELERAQLAQQQIIQQYGFLADELSQAMSASVTAIVTGTGTVEEAFSRMFANIGQAFVQMATQMMAQKLFMTVLSAFGGAAGGLGGSGASSFGIGPVGGGLFGGGSLGTIGFAGGGYTGDAPRSGGIDGEGGFPAILHPQETVIDHSSLRGGMGGKSGGGGASPITLNVTATKIGGEEFVKINDLQVALRNSEKRAAAQGEQRAMAKFQNSPRTRKRLGIA